MSTLHISTKDSNRANSLRDYLSQHGLNVVMLSPTELEVEGSLSAELRDEISSWQHHGLEITVVSHTAAESDSAEQTEGELDDFEIPQREFILAPHWRKIKATTAGFGTLFAAKGKQARIASGRISTWLHETEEKILARSKASDEERKIAEEKTWTETVQPIESMHRAETPRAPAVPLRERLHSATAFLTMLNSRMAITDGGKAAAFAGAVVMAGLIGIGLSVSHVDKSSAATLHPSATASPVSAKSIEPSRSEHQTSSAKPKLREAAGLSKPSPVKSARASQKSHRPAEVVVHRYQNDVAEDEGPEVVTHYYHQKAVSQMRKTTNNGVKRYSDLD